MSIVIKHNTQGFMSSTIQSNIDSGTVNGQEKKQNKGVGKSIFAGQLNLIEDPIAKKRKEAQQKALKVVRNAWESDQAIENSIQERRDNIDKIKKDKERAEEALECIKANKTALKEEYGIEDDSEEQKDLELLQKNKNGQQLTDEEKDRLFEVLQKPRTEYQQKAMDLGKEEAKFRNDVEKAEGQIQGQLSAIRSIKLEDLKSDPMVKANKDSADILQAASEEIIGMLKNEVKENIDEEIEEEKEKGKEAAKEKEKEEERLEDMQEKRAIQEALITGTKEAVEKAEATRRKNDRMDIPIEETIELAQAGGQSGDVQKLLNEIKSSMNMLEADLKGIKVDEAV